MNAPLSTPDQDARGSFLRVTTPEPGRCGLCTSLTCEFISRAGETKCVPCDAKESFLSERLLKQQEVAAKLNVTTKTLQKWRRSGELPCVRFAHNAVRYEPEVVDGYIRQHRSEVGHAID